MIKGIYHVNVNCSDFERSLAFYQMLGFKKATDMGDGGSKAFEVGLGLPGCHARAVLLILGDDPHATRLDLIEWKAPKVEGSPHPTLAHLGYARIALYTNDIEQDYQRLAANGVKFLSDIQSFRAGGHTVKFVCFHDPDGSFLELIAFSK